MTSKDELFNQLVKKNIFEYELADSPHQCRCCGNTTDPTFKLIFDEEGDKDISNEQPYLYICGECYRDAINQRRKENG